METLFLQQTVKRDIKRKKRFSSEKGKEIQTRILLWFRGVDRTTRIIYCTAAALLLCTIVAALSVTGKPDYSSLNDLVIGQDHMIDDLLISYVSVDFDGKGSGDMFIPEGAVILSVNPIEYTLQRGDTLSELALKYGLDVGTLISFNNISDVRRIQAGNRIKIPDIDGVPYTVKRGDSIESIANAHNVTLNMVLDANNLESELITPGQQLFIPGARINEYDYRKAMGTLFVYPAVGRLTSPFGYRIDPFAGVRRMHYGIDLANRTGTDIVASQEGRVVTIDDRPRGYGKFVVVRHNHGYQTLYAHLSRINVRLGQTVRQGQKIGEMGNSGLSTGPHLHFSIYKNNIPVNPLNYLYR